MAGTHIRRGRLDAASDHAANLFERGDAGHGEAEPVFLERDHAGADGFTLYLLGGLADQLADAARHRQHLVDSGAPVIAALAAAAAADRVVEDDLVLGRESQLGKLGLACLCGWRQE